MSYIPHLHLQHVTHRTSRIASHLGLVCAYPCRTYNVVTNNIVTNVQLGGVCFPHHLPAAELQGAISGMIGGIIFSLWVSIGSIVYSPTPKTLNITPANWTLCPISDTRRRELYQQSLATYVARISLSGIEY